MGAKKLAEMRRKIALRRHELEGFVIDSLERGAVDVLDVIADCGELTWGEKVYVCNATHRIMGVRERVHTVPQPHEAVLL